MFVIADTACLAHKTIELLGSKLIPAKESPERLVKILDAIEGSGLHKLKLKHTPPEQSLDLLDKLDNNEDLEVGAKDYDHECMDVLMHTHDRNYLYYLAEAHARWVANGLIEENESILPECFRVPSRVVRPGIRLNPAKFYTMAELRELRDKPQENSGPPLPTPPPRDIYAQAGYYAFDMSTGICKDTWHSTWASALLAYSAVLVLRGVYNKNLKIKAQSDRSRPPKDVLALCRPPGHHCNTNMAGGYCYVNNAVVAVRAFERYHQLQGGVLSIGSVAILDLDFHHGNGTQDFFYDSDNVLYVSIHGEDEYPYYTGAAHETGIDRGVGFNCNLPLPAGSSFQEYLVKLNEAIAKIQQFQPDYLVVSLGFDTFETDPLGCFKIGTEDYETMAAQVRKSAGLQNIPCAILLEGGYVVDKLGANMLSFMKGWES